MPSVADIDEQGLMKSARKLLLIANRMLRPQQIDALREELGRHNPAQLSVSRVTIR